MGWLKKRLWNGRIKQDAFTMSTNVERLYFTIVVDGGCIICYHQRMKIYLHSLCLSENINIFTFSVIIAW